MNLASYSATLNIYGFPNPGTPNSATKALRSVKKRSHRELEPVTPEILKTLLDTVTELRDRALLLVLIESGLRVGEITSLDRGTIQAVLNRSSDGSEVKLGSGRVLKSPSCYRTFWVGSATVSAVVEYLANDRSEDEEPALFVTKRGKRISTPAIAAAVAGWCGSAGIDPVGCFRFRHTLGVALACAVVPYSQLLKLLGYSNPESVTPHIRESSDHPCPGIYRRLLGLLNTK